MMQGFKLLKKSGGLSAPALKIKCLKKRFFFREDDIFCYRLDSHIDYMLFNGIVEMNLWLAKKENNTPYFFADTLEKLAKNQRAVVEIFAKVTSQKTENRGCVKIMAILMKKAIFVSL